VYVPKDMLYEDKTQKLAINFQKGWQVLNGDQAEQFARFRNDELGDIGRVQRQQTLLKALKDQLSNPLIGPRIPGILHIMQNYVDTNLSFEELSALINYGLGLEQKAVKMVLLPGRFSGPKEFRSSYWILEEAGRDRIMKEYFGIGSGQDNATIAPIRIAVQNASNQPDAAQRIARKLEQAGYENVYIVDNWSETLTQTQIIIQSGQEDAAVTLQKTIGIGILETSSTGELESDVTLRIGDDIGTH